MYHLLARSFFILDCLLEDSFVAFLLDCLDFSSEHQALEVGNRVEASVYVWHRRAINRPVSCANRTSTKSSWAMMKELMEDAEKRELLVDRADMIISVIIKQAGLKLQHNTIFLNIVSGFKLEEPAGDLAIAAAICSSFLEVPIPKDATQI